MNIMIFAAGLGTRLKPLTDIIPKALVPVDGRPLLQHVLENTDGEGNTTVINMYHHASQIRNFIEVTQRHWASRILLSDETDKLLDTGGGIRKAAALFRNSRRFSVSGKNEDTKKQNGRHKTDADTCDTEASNDSPVLIHNVDILSNVNLQEFYSHNLCNDATLLVSRRKTSRYLLFDSKMRLVGWTNILTGEIRSPYRELTAQRGNPTETLTLNGTPICMLAFSGIHIISQNLFPLMDKMPEKFGIIDFYLSVCDSCNIRGVEKEDLRLLDVGKLDSLEKANKFFNQL